MERFPARGTTALNVHEATRLALRKWLAEAAPERFRTLSARAAEYFASDLTSAEQIEWVFHLLTSDPERGADELESLDRDWSGSAPPEDRYALAAALNELEDTELVQGRARVWVLLVVAWTRVGRGEAAQLKEAAGETLLLAEAAADQRAIADAKVLFGDVLQAQGQLEAAQEAFGENLAISRRLAQQDPSNAVWQREFAVVCWWVVHLRKEAGRAEAALALYEEAAHIFGELAEFAPGVAQWAKDKVAVEADLARCRRLILEVAPDGEPPQDST